MSMRRLMPAISITLLFLGVTLAQARLDSIIKEYRGIFIGSERSLVHEKLGNPKNEFTGEDNFELSESESVRVFYDDAKKVKAIVVTYSGTIDAAPKPSDVIGEKIEARPDGGMYKLVRVEDKGFWVSYVKVAGDTPSVIITVQSVRKAG